MFSCYNIFGQDLDGYIVQIIPNHVVYEVVLYLIYV